MSIPDFYQVRGELHQPQEDAIRDVGKVLCWSGMGVSALAPVFLTEGREYFWTVLIIFSMSYSAYLALFGRQIIRNLLYPVIIVFFTAMMWYPFSGVTLELALLRTPWVLTLVSVSAVEYDRFRNGFLSPREPPTSIGSLSVQRSGSPRLPAPEGNVLAGMGSGLEWSSSIGSQSDLSLTSDEVSDEELSLTFDTDLEAADPGGEHRRL